MRRHALLVIAAMVLLAACEDTPTIRGNLDAESKVEAGMSMDDFTIANPRPPFTTLNLVKATGGELWTLSTIENGKPIELKAALAEDVDSPYFAWIFFPTVTGSSRPTFITFRSEDQLVIDVQRVGCDATLFILATGRQHIRVPAGSACKP